ncbi:MAG: COG4705 family protein [Candidatus Binatia bacterium]
MTGNLKSALIKVPAVTLAFWIIKIFATTLGETAGDAVSMSWLGETTADAPTSFWEGGYLIGTGIFATALAVLVFFQIRARRFNPWLYWSAIIASTTAGTTMADLATRSLGIGYPGGSILLLSLVLLSLFVWHRALGTVSINSLHEPKAELYYWLTITFSQTLGTALGDWIADGPLGYLGSAVIFGSLLAAIALAYFRTSISHVALFWAAFILTRPLGAVVGDFLDKPIAKGGLDLSRVGASAVLIVAIVALILLVRQKAAEAAYEA